MGTQQQGTQQQLELVRLAAAVRANLDDARVWRWYADLMEEDRIACTRTRDGWRLTIDGHHVVEDASFDAAVRRAADIWCDQPRLSPALGRRSKRARLPGATPLPDWHARRD
ncbi:hypothetical protein [Burkholderia plantarii]|uniref:hypothetical protein n=1 Tax=Burkholderia plantarii TaxID=41899 RepID=UPI0008709BCA|nr:hypothetical protein [Burkholderia plantarii]